MADASLGRAVLYLTTDDKDLNRGLDAAKQSGDALASKFQAIGTAIAASLSFNAIAGAASDITDATGRLTDLAAKAGISAEAVQELDFVAKQSGSDFDAVSGALARMSKSLVDAPKAAIAATEALGLSINDLKAMSPDQAFQTIATAIAQVEDPMMRSKIAMDLFGRAGADLLPVLTSDIAGLRQEARDTGLVLTNELVAAGDNVGDSWEQMQTRLETLKAQALLPVLEAFTQMPTAMQNMVGAGLTLLPALQNIGIAIVAAGGPMAAVGMLKTAFLGLASLLTLPAGLVVAAIVGLVAIWYKWDEIKVIVQNVYAAVKTWLVDRFQAVVDGIKAKIDAVTGFFRGMYEKVVGHSYVPDLVNGIASQFSRLTTVMVTPTQAATSTVAGQFQTLLNGLSGMFQAAFTGGGGALGAVQAFATKGLSTLMNMIPVVGSFISQFAGPIIAGIGKIGAAFKNLFGGPSADELAGREVVAKFEDNLAAMLSETQRLEAGHESWKATVIALRDKYIEMGRTEQEAMRDAGRLWASSKEGAQDAARVIDEIRRKLEGGIRVPVSFDVAGLDLPDLPGITPMAKGGFGRVTRPTLFLAGEAGAEDVAFSGGGRSFGGVGGETVIHTHVMLDGREVGTSVERFLNHQLRMRQMVGAR